LAKLIRAGRLLCSKFKLLSIPEILNSQDRRKQILIHLISNNMALDLRKTWFHSILTADQRQLTRLLYCTPNPDSGRQRLEWTASTADPYLADILPLNTLNKAQEKFGVVFSEINGFTAAILMLGDQNTSERLEIARLLCGVSSWITIRYNSFVEFFA
jgi:hypothetical protein